MLINGNLFMIGMQVRQDLLRGVSAMLLRAVQCLAQSHQVDIKPRPRAAWTTSERRVATVTAGYSQVSHPSNRRRLSLLLRL